MIAILQPLSLLHKLPGKLRSNFNLSKRLIDPRRWSAAKNILADLLTGGIVVPPAQSAEHWSKENDEQVLIWSIIQPDGDIQLVVARALLESDDFEAELARHLEDVEETLTRVRDAMAQLLTLRVCLALPAFGALGKSAVDFFSDLKRDDALAEPAAWSELLADAWSALLQGLDWRALVLAGLFLIAGWLLPRILGWFVKLRFKKLAQDLKRYEKKRYPQEEEELSPMGA